MSQDANPKITIEADDYFEQLQALMKALSAAPSNWREPTFGSPLIVEDLAPLEKSCAHTWKPYIGFTDSYNYCEYCGVKQ